MATPDNDSTDTGGEADVDQDALAAERDALLMQMRQMQDQINTLQQQIPANETP